MLKEETSSLFWWSILLGFPYYLWVWNIGTKLRPQEEKANSISQIIFKASIIFPTLYCLWGLVYMMTTGETILPLHFAAMLSIFYSIIIAAKALKSAELKRKAKVSEFLGDFFLFWFFPIGIWVLHPRVLKLVKQ